MKTKFIFDQQSVSPRYLRIFQCLLKLSSFFESSLGLINQLVKPIQHNGHSWRINSSMQTHWSVPSMLPSTLQWPACHHSRETYGKDTITVEAGGSNIEIYSCLTVKISFPCWYQKYHTQVDKKLCTVMCADVAFLFPCKCKMKKCFLLSSRHSCLWHLCPDKIDIKIVSRAKYRGKSCYILEYFHCLSLNYNA